MNYNLLKRKMDKFFKETSADELVEKFEKLNNHFMIQIKGTNLWAVKMPCNDLAKVASIIKGGLFELLGEVTKDNISFDVTKYGFKDEEEFRAALLALDLYWVNPMGEKPVLLDIMPYTESEAYKFIRPKYNHPLQFEEVYVQWQYYQDNLLSETTKLLIPNKI